MTAHDCDLCVAARLTEWFHEDDDCWIAECTICATPMVVWKVHDPRRRPRCSAGCTTASPRSCRRTSRFEHYVDDDMRRIPDHYHAHARPVGGFFGHGLPRKQPP